MPRAPTKTIDLLIKRPTTGTALERVFGYHVERGTIGDLLKTLTDKAQSTTNSDESGRLYLLAGLLHLERGEDARAAVALEKAQALLKDNALAAFHHGQALIDPGR